MVAWLGQYNVMYIIYILPCGAADYYRQGLEFRQHSCIYCYYNIVATNQLMHPCKGYIIIYSTCALLFHTALVGVC